MVYKARESTSGEPKSREPKSRKPKSRIVCNLLSTIYHMLYAICDVEVQEA